MKQEYIDWFINNRESKQVKVDFPDRRYVYTNKYYTEVPFHTELKEYIYSLDDITQYTEYHYYHIHTWKEGDFFKEHIDGNYRRKWAYVCELQPSECKTKLVVDGLEMEEGIFDAFTLHRVPKIRQGTRISLTVFGSSTPSVI